MSPTIAFDAEGGELAPAEVVRGVARLSLETELDLLLVGDEPRVSLLLEQTRHNAERIAVHHAPARPGSGPAPADTLSQAARLVAQGVADALVTAGHTADCLEACERHFSLIPGVRQAALAAVFPTEQRRGAKADPFSLLLDVGAHLEADAEDLLAYAEMGAAYARLISKNPTPRVGLLSSGAEAARELPAIVEADHWLHRMPDVEHAGKLVGGEIPKGAVDVVVTSGFVGSVVLRMLEGVAETVLDMARYASHEKLAWRMGVRMLSGGLRRLKRVTDWEEYGGAPLLGYDKVVIKAHGKSGSRAIANAGKIAAKAVAARLPSMISERMGEERRFVAGG